MKILSGLVYHESNTFNPFPTGLDQFVVQDGEPILDRFASTPVLRDAGAQLVPGVFATAFSSGIVERETYEDIKGRLLRAVEDNLDLDGIWLHLHGAMLVEEVGSAEIDILSALRERVGDQVPITVAMDPHGNIDPRVAELATVMRAYRTIPHVDQPEVERRMAEQLVAILRGEIDPGAIAHTRVPFVISGDIPLTAQSPLSDILTKLDEAEAVPGILDASYYVGFAWADVTQCGGSVVVVPESAEHADVAREQAESIRDYITERFPEFRFTTPTLGVPETVATFPTLERTPLVVSDSGDNTTGGGVGYSTVLLKEILDAAPEGRVCVSTILDPAAVRALEAHDVGDEVELEIGMGHDEVSSPVKVRGTLSAKGDLLGYMSSASDRIGATATVTVGNVDVVVTDKPGSFVSVDHFRAAGMSPDGYAVIVVKQGYMFPEIAELAAEHILCISPGATYQFIENLAYENVESELVFVAEPTPR